MEILKFFLPFFSTTKSYDEQLSRLAVITFYEVYGISFFLRGEIPAINRHLADLEKYGLIGKALSTIIPHYDVLNFGGAAIALVVAIITHIFHFHDRISDAIGIRHRYDPKHILIPLADLVGSPTTPGKIKTIRHDRIRLMGDLFYRYASSRDDHPLVGKHNVEHALSAWSWFWVLLEGIVYFGVATGICFCFGATHLRNIFLIVTIIYITLAGLQRYRLNRYARPQIEAIALDAVAAAYVKQKFDAL